MCGNFACWNHTHTHSNKKQILTKRFDSIFQFHADKLHPNPFKQHPKVGNYFSWQHNLLHVQEMTHFNVESDGFRYLMKPHKDSKMFFVIVYFCTLRSMIMWLKCKETSERLRIIPFEKIQHYVNRATAGKSEDTHTQMQRGSQTTSTRNSSYI